MPLRLALAAIALTWCLPLDVPARADADARLGWSATRPEEGSYVETPDGFMVPYRTTIPGTDVSYDMMPIPGGTIRIGSPPDEPGRLPDEGPTFEVVVEPFWMGSREVTWAEYREYMRMYDVFKRFEVRRVRRVDETNRADAVTAPTPLYDPTFTFEFGQEDNLPAVTMTQFAAKQYTKWLSGLTGHQYRLPSEAEWEYACRAGTTTAYHFGDDPAELDEYGWYAGNSDGQPQPVGQKRPNAWGLYDMHGNVWEWVLDEYRQDGYARFDGGRVTAEDAIAWPTEEYPRVVRGGSWQDPADRCRSAAKLGSHDDDWKMFDPNLPLSPWWYTSDPARGVGFRFIRPLQELPADEMARFWEADIDWIREDVESRLMEGRGVLGLADPELPEAINAE